MENKKEKDIMTNEDKSELKQLAKQGLSFKEIKDIVSCSDTTIKRYIRVFDKKIRTVRATSKSRVTRTQARNAAKLSSYKKSKISLEELRKTICEDAQKIPSLPKEFDCDSVDFRAGILVGKGRTYTRLLELILFGKEK